MPRLSKSNRFNSSSTKPLNLKYSPLFSEFAKPDETKTKDFIEFFLQI